MFVIDAIGLRERKARVDVGNIGTVCRTLIRRCASAGTAAGLERLRELLRFLRVLRIDQAVVRGERGASLHMRRVIAICAAVAFIRTIAKFLNGERDALNG